MVTLCATQVAAFVRVRHDGPMPQKPPAPTPSSLPPTLGYPMPSPQALDKLHQIHLNRVGTPLTHPQAQEVLERLLRFVYLLNLPEASALKETNAQQ